MSETIEQLEGQVWNEPDDQWSQLILTCHELRKKPIDQFSVEDLRVMIEQNVGTEHLMPRALEMLERDPLVWDYHYPGELLHSVMHLPSSYWEIHPKHLKRALSIAELTLQRLEETWTTRREEARRLYGAELDEMGCREYPEGDLHHWAQGFISSHQAKLPGGYD
ncbi:MAG: contact-dependent growth inhibition system immunity protein [Bacteroidota bacterium]